MGISGVAPGLSPRAGSIWGPGWRSSGGRDHPHICGEQFEAAGLSGEGVGPSPHARGATRPMATGRFAGLVRVTSLDQRAVLELVFICFTVLQRPVGVVFVGAPGLGTKAEPPCLSVSGPPLPVSVRRRMTK